MKNPIPVTVRIFPEGLTSSQTSLFFRQLEPLLNSVQPRIVFDFAEVRELSTAGVQVLLTCLEEAMKRNGDVKLATVLAGPSVVLEHMGVDHLFEIFENPAEAVQSFHYLAECQPDLSEAPVFANQLPAAGEVVGFAAD